MRLLICLRPRNAQLAPLPNNVFDHHQVVKFLLSMIPWVLFVQTIFILVRKSAWTILFVQPRVGCFHLVAKQRTMICTVVAASLLIIVPITFSLSFKRHYILMQRFYLKRVLRHMLAITAFLFKKFE